MSGTTIGSPIRSKLLASVFASAAALAVVLAFWLVAGGNAQLPAAAADADDELATETVADEVEDDAPVVTPAATTHAVFLSRDPFKPVVPEPEVVEATQTGAVDGTGTTNPDGTTPDGTTPGGTNPDGTTQPIAAPGTCTQQGELICSGTVVSLREVRTVGAEQVAFIQVHTTTYEVRPGEQFAGAFQLRSIDDASCITLLYGDEAFSLCQGGQVVK